MTQPRQLSLPRLALAVSLALLVGAALSTCSSDPAPELIFRGGPVLTVNNADAVAEALAVRDGVIVAVGTDAQVYLDGKLKFRAP